jgi:hypothetical protein
MEILMSVEDVIKALGGVTKAASLLGAKPNAVSNWQHPTRGHIPIQHYFKVSKALEDVGKTVDPSVFDVAPKEAAE